MTENELMTMQEGTFSYDFKPATIEIKDYENLVKTAQMVADHYDSLVFKNSTLSEINESHRELNSFINGLNESRLSVKRQYNEPLKAFEDKIKVLTNTLNKPLQDIKDARDEILVAQEEARKEALIDYLERQLKETNVRVEDLEIEDSWTNKGNWTDKLNPRKVLTDEIKKHIEYVKEEFRKKIADRQILETFLDDKGMEHEGWVAQLEYRESLDIIQDIQRAEEERKQKEQQEKDAAERRLQEKAQEVEQLMDQPVEEVPDGIARTFEEAKQVKPQLITERIEVTGTVEQLNQLNQFLVAKGIKVQPIIDETNETTDDLPF